MKSDITRRSFLKYTGGGIVGMTLLPLTGCEFNGVDPITRGERIALLTPVEDFYYKNGAEISIEDWTMPIIPRDDWTLEVTGMVSNPMTFRFDDLTALSSSEVDLLKTMRCVIDSNEVRGLVGTGVWSGVPLRLLLERTGVDTERGRRLRIFGADGFRNNLPLERVLGENDPSAIDPILVTRLNDVPLPARHGAPVRLIVPEMFGYKNIKWISRIEVTEDDSPFGTYQDAGFVDDGEMRLNSRTTDPLHNATVSAGEVLLGGYAVSGAGGIVAVEVSVDQGEWIEARLVSYDEAVASDRLVARSLQARDPNRYAWPWRGVWRTWSIPLTLDPGRHAIRVRAVDSTGETQPEVDLNGISDGVNGYATLTIEAR